MKKLNVRTVIAALALCTTAWCVTEANAAPITISSCYTGACGSFAGSVVVTITDDTLNENAGDNDIKFVIQNLTNGFVDEIGLLYTGGLPALPAIESFTASHTTGAPAVTLGLCPNDNSGQSLNLCLDFPNPNASRLKAGQSVTFFFDSNTAAYSAGSFAAGKAYAHIQGLANSGSVKITDPPSTSQVPEPTSMLLLGSGVAAFTAWRRRRRGANG
jgi:hypothetical protein